MNSKLLILASLALFQTAFANTLILNEEKLLSLTKSKTASLDLIESNFNQAKLDYNNFQNRFESKLNFGANYAETKEVALFSFAPIFSPTRTIYTSIEKQNQSGTSLGMQLSNDQRSTTNGTVNNANTSTIAVSMNINLWKNFLGSLTSAESENSKINFEKAKIENELAINNFKLQLRKIYWSIAANQEAIKISQGLLDTSIVQAEDAKKRLKNSVADISEVARYESQVASRKSSMLYLQYQRESLQKQLKEELPELMQADISIDDKDFSKIIANVLECTAVISTQKSTPLEFTMYDEISQMLGTAQLNQMKIASKKDSMDVDLSLAYQVRGVNSPSVGQGTLSNSISDFQDNDRSGYQVALKVNIPFGENLKESKISSEIIANKRYQAQVDKLISQMEATHIRVQKSISLLNEVVQNQKYNSVKLKERLTEMKKKYSQARVSVNDLVNDQDALLNSDLSIIQTQLEVVYTLFDYFSIFDKTPCAFNRNI